MGDVHGWLRASSGSWRLREDLRTSACSFSSAAAAAAAVSVARNRPSADPLRRPALEEGAHALPGLRRVEQPRRQPDHLLAVLLELSPHVPGDHLLGLG